MGVSKRTFLIVFAAAIVGVSILLLVGCAPGQATRDADDEDAVATVGLSPWTSESDCAVCHTTEVESGLDSVDLYGFHQVSNSSMPCNACHNQNDALATVHEGKTVENKVSTRLKETEVDSALCLSCHVEDELSGLTAGVTVLTDFNGTTVNPHQLASSDSHDKITCSDCHKMHQPIADIPENAQTSCIRCHHAGVYDKCSTCHDE